MRLTPEDLADRIRTAREDDPGIGTRRLAQEFGISRSRIRYAIRAYLDSESQSVSGPLSESLAGTRFSTRATWMRDIFPSVLDDCLVIAKKELARTNRPKRKSQTPRSSGDYMLELCLPDLHIGKKCWPEETGNDYDIGIACDLAWRAVEELMDKASHRDLAHILFPVGNDLFHVDNLFGTTAAGTRQDTDDRVQKMFQAGLSLMIELIDRLSETAPVTALLIPGNHDPLVSPLLGIALAEVYAGTEGVMIDAGPKPRKYFSWRNAHVGLTHGGKADPRLEDLPLLMLTEPASKDAANKAVWKEWHVGHWHKRRSLVYLGVESYPDITVRVIPSLTATDAWHFGKGYVGQSSRTAEAFLIDGERGLESHLSTFPVGIK